MKTKSSTRTEWEINVFGGPPRTHPPTQAYAATEVLLDTYGVDLIVGPACCSSAAAASALAARKGVPVVSWACSAAHLSDKVYTDVDTACTCTLRVDKPQERLRGIFC